jgi:hypothetical protein
MRGTTIGQERRALRRAIIESTLQLSAPANAR